MGINKEKAKEKLLANIEINENGCWIWKKYCLPYGYGRLRINDKMYLSHRLSWEGFNGDIPIGFHVCHKCDTENCINPNHLFLGTDQDNSDDKIRKGRSKHLFGIDNPNSKLTENKVVEIRKLIDEGYTQQYVSEKNWNK